MSKGCAIILAAGTSSRMGQPKQLLDLGGELLLERVIRIALSIPFVRVYTVIGYEAARIQQAIQIIDSRFQWLINPDYGEGQSTSIKLGMETAGKDHSSATVFLGDQPFISKETIKHLYREGQKLCEEHSDPFVLQPVFQAKTGHPVFFGNLQITQFQTMQGDRGGKQVFHQMHRLQLPVHDPGILFDIDTPQAYQCARRIASVSSPDETISAEAFFNLE